MDGCAVGDVAGEGEDAGGVAVGGLGQGIDGGGELVGVACGDGYVGSVFDEALGDAESDAAVAAGYEGGFAVERSKGESWREWWDMGLSVVVFAWLRIYGYRKQF